MVRRRSLWDDTLINTNIDTGSTGIITLTLTPGAASEGFTVVRTLVRIALSKNTTPAADSQQIVSLGIGLASKEAITLGSTALPDPDINTDTPIMDWVWRDRCVVVEDAGQMIPPTMCVGDYRSARKLGGGGLYLSIVNTAFFGTAFTVRAIGIVRCLLLRP